MSIQASSQALAKLEPYLLLAKSARGAAAAKLVQEATAAPGCYVFAELLECEGIKELANDETHAGVYRMLQLFSFGDLMQYNNEPQGTYPPLSDAHLTKLRQLTLVSLASTSRNLAYSTLIPSLGLDLEGKSTLQAASTSSSAGTIRPRAMRQLEDVVIDAIYAGILSARIDQQRQRLEVESVMGRDVPMAGGIDKLSRSLNEWSSTTTHVLETLAARIEDAKRRDQQRTQGQADYDADLERVLTALTNNQGSNGDGTIDGNGGRRNQGSDRNGDMDLDDDGAVLRKKKSSSGGNLRSKRTRA